MSYISRALIVALEFVCLLCWSECAIADAIDCSRPLTLSLHEHGLLYSSESDAGIDKDLSNELIRRSGCRIKITLMPRAKIWQLIESGSIDFSLSGIANAERDKFAAFAWYIKNSYYLLVRKDAFVGGIAEFERNHSLRLGVIRSFRYSETANTLVDRLTVSGRVCQSNGLAPLYQALSDNDIQGMIIEPFDYPALDEKMIRGMTDIFAFSDPAVLHGLIMSKKSLPYAEQVNWRQLIKGMRDDGTVRRIFEKYFSTDLAARMTDFEDAP